MSEKQISADIIKECCDKSRIILRELRDSNTKELTKRFIIEYLMLKAIKRGFVDLKRDEPKAYATIIKIVDKHTKIIKFKREADIKEEIKKGE